MARLPGFEAIEDPPKEDDGVLPSTSDEGSPKIAQFKPEDLNRYLMNKEAQDLLKVSGTSNSLLNILKRIFLPLIQ